MRTIPVLIVGVLCLAVSAGGASALSYELTDLGTLGGTSVALDLNNHGQVVGYSEMGDGTLRAFIWDAVNGMQGIGAPGDHFSAQGINDAGQVVGGTAGQGFVWSEAGGMQYLNWGEATAINEQGQVVGMRRVTENEYQAYVWQEGMGRTDIDTLGGNSYAYDINENGTVVGTAYTSGGVAHAYTWDPVLGLTDLQTFGGDWAVGHAINDSGQVAGTAYGFFGLHISSLAVDWDEINGTYLLPTIEADSQGLDINRYGAIVGSSNEDNGPWHAALWHPDYGLLDLNQMYTAEGWSLINAEAINDRGQIVGYGTKDGVGRAYLLTLILPEPSGMLLMGMGLAGLGLRIGRKRT